MVYRRINPSIVTLKPMPEITWRKRIKRLPRNRRRFSTSDVEMEGREDRTQIQQIDEERIVNSGQSKPLWGKIVGL